MRCPASCVLLFLALLGVAGCSYPIRNEAIVSANRDQYKWTDPGPNSFGDTLVIVTASGGGTRAAALSMAVLRTMDAVRLPSGKSLADEIDVLSSVSGGSVTAGYFALTGAAGLPTLEKNFIRKDGMTPLLLRGLNPVGLAVLSTPSTERIDLFIDYIDQQLFKDATFKALIGRRPYLILNAADMVEGVPFPFTQYTMDLLCSDLTPMKLSTAVAASAAFPVALSPVTLKNYQPCKIEESARLAEAGGADKLVSRSAAGRPRTHRTGLCLGGKEIHPSAGRRDRRQSRRQRAFPPADQRRCRAAVQGRHRQRPDQEDHLRDGQRALGQTLRARQPAGHAGCHRHADRFDRRVDRPGVVQHGGAAADPAADRFPRHRQRCRCCRFQGHRGQFQDRGR